MNDELFKTILTLCMILDDECYSIYHKVLVKNADTESKARGFTGWVDAYHKTQ